VLARVAAASWVDLAAWRAGHTAATAGSGLQGRRLAPIGRHRIVTARSRGCSNGLLRPTVPRQARTARAWAPIEAPRHVEHWVSLWTGAKLLSRASRTPRRNGTGRRHLHPRQTSAAAACEPLHRGQYHHRLANGPHSDRAQTRPEASSRRRGRRPIPDAGRLPTSGSWHIDLTGVARCTSAAAARTHQLASCTCAHRHPAQGATG